MENIENLYLVLGCFGRRDGKFISCPGVDNPILNINSTALFNYNDMMSYLDSHRFFDKPMFDYNGVRHLLFNLRDKFEQPAKPLWSNQEFDLFQKFIISHRHCGTFLKLVLATENDILPEDEPKTISISKTVNKEIERPEEQKSSLRLIRGRR